jgi:16S rRNA (uracil1498-N3)-methyltransferase
LAPEGAPSFVHLPTLPEGGGPFALGGEEARYLARVVRVRPGEHVSATDGRGGRVTLEILEVRPELRVRAIAFERRERAATLELWCGAPEGDRADWLVEKLAELGVATLVPVQFERGAWDRLPARLERFERLAVAALRQSRSAFRMSIAPGVTLPNALAQLGNAPERWVCAQQGGPPPAGRLATGRTVAVVGPSSGFTANELNLLSEHAFVTLALARHRLRTETAAVAAAARWAALDAVAGGAPGGGCP